MKHRLSLVCVFVFSVFLPLGLRSAATPAPAPTVSDAPRATADASGNTPLHRAALRGDAAAVEALLNAGADPNTINQAGATPLHYATGSERTVAALLAHGARPDVMSKSGRSPLMTAVVRANSYPVVRRLIEAGADVNLAPRNGIGPVANASILTLAILARDQRTIDLLFEHKAAVNSPGFSPLAAAAQIDDVATARRLIALGADLNQVSSLPGPPVNLALINGHTEIARLLVEQGANLRLGTTRGYATPPMVLSGYNTGGDAAAARLLAAHGVDVNTTDDGGETALSFALRENPDNELIRFLHEAGAKSPMTPVRTKTVPARTVPTDVTARALLVRESAQRSVDLLQRSSGAFLKNKHVSEETKCVSCHQQSLPAVAFGLARERGLQVDDNELGRLLAATLAARGAQKARALELDQPTPAATTSLGYEADGLHALGYVSDEVTEAMSHYLLGIQQADGSWLDFIRRVPMGDGPMVATAWSVRAIQLYPPKDRGAELDASLRRAREWLLKQSPRTTNEQTFQILGLAWGNETKDRMRPLADALLKEQRPDGGWAQLPALASDAWATGSALIALQRAGIPVAHEAYQRGVDFLLRTQFDDGSWWVRSRTWPFQPHFDSQFPHGKDQWISAGGTAWATIALLFTLEPTVRPENLPNGQALIAKFAAAKDGRVAAVSSRTKPSLPAAVNFARDIAPVLERSCAGCHAGEKVKGHFSLATREGMLKGGQSGDPAVVPGNSAASALVSQVSDQIEDLEMPPLNRRGKYPALSRDEIARLKTWIDAGAEWDAPPLKTAAVSRVP